MGLDRVETWDVADSHQRTYWVMLGFGNGGVSSFGCLVLVIIGLVGHEGWITNKRSASAFIPLVVYYHA